jgi:hypothetical protein
MPKHRVVLKPIVKKLELEEVVNNMYNLIS